MQKPKNCVIVVDDRLHKRLKEYVDKRGLKLGFYVQEILRKAMNANP